MIALTVLLLVNPETLDVIRLRAMGMLTAKTAEKASPDMRPACSFKLYTKTIPTMAIVVLKIISSTRAFRSFEARKEVKSRKRISAPPLGICSKIEMRSLKPKPLTRRGWN